MKKYLPLPFLLASYLIVIIPFSGYMRNKPFVEKIGYIPQAEVLRFFAADQKIQVANLLTMKALMYYGSLIEKNQAKYNIPPDYFSIYKTVETAVKLDPYNLDGYYFVQAVIAWDAKRIKESNALLEYGVKYRTWDYQLPFFLGFNYGYFLKDYPNAAKYYQRAAELSGEPLLSNIAGRYMYESGRTDAALAYLGAMEKGARSDAIRKSFQVRMAAFREVRRVEAAITQYRSQYGVVPRTIDELRQRGCLDEPPVDPYGGKFYIDDKGQVRTTSKFAYAGVGKDVKQGNPNERH
jgi:tetratricopeptide (TPR) repeat protein